MSHQWQSDMPLAEMQAIGSAILARSFTLADVREAWVVAEYAVGHVVPEAGARALSAPCSGSPEDALRAMVEHATRESEAKATAPDAGVGARGLLPPLPWTVILKAVLQAIVGAL